MLAALSCSVSSAMSTGGARHTPPIKLTVVPGRWARDPSALRRKPQDQKDAPAIKTNVDAAAASVRKILDDVDPWGSEPMLEQQLAFIENGYFYDAVPTAVALEIDADPLEQQVKFVDELNNEEPMEQRTLAAHHKLHHSTRPLLPPRQLSLMTLISLLSSLLSLLSSPHRARVLQARAEEGGGALELPRR